MLLENYFNKLSKISDDFFDTPELNNDNIKTDNQTWINFYYQNPLFRHVHLEYYHSKKIEVVHVNHFPNPLANLPILGLDVIALGNKITGFFMDFTPMVEKHPLLDSLLISLKNSLPLSKERNLPEWADFFGQHFICLMPHVDEINIVFDNSISVYEDYLKYVKIYLNAYDENIQAQNKYCVGQKKNDKTLKALALDVGQDKAKLFMENNLFPEIK
jgi:hypothetical protein